MGFPGIIEYKLTKKDHHAWHIYHFVNRAPEMKRRFVVKQLFHPLVYLFAFFVFGYFLGGWHPLTLGLWSIIFLGSLVRLFFWPQRYRKLIKKIVEKDQRDPKNAHYLGTHWLSIKPDGIHCATEFAEHRIDWRAVQEIVEIDNYIFICIGSSDAIILPKEFFAEESTLEDFVNTAKKYHEDVNRHQEDD